MSDQSQTFIVTFDNKNSYETYKKEVQTKGGRIINDLGPVLMGFTAAMPLTLVETFKGNLVGGGISSFGPDGVATIQ